MKSCGWLKGDSGGKLGSRGYCREGSDSGGLSLFGNVTPPGPCCGSESLDCLLGSFTKNLSDDTCFCLHLKTLVS